VNKADALSHYRSTIRLAAAMTAAGYPMTRNSVSGWGEVVPELVARRIAEVSGGAVPLRVEDYREEVAA
jgi:hypothetical protein